LLEREEHVKRRTLLKLGTAVLAAGSAARFTEPGLTTPASAAENADYPSRTVTMIHGFAPGGATEGSARMVGEELEKRLGQSVVVDARPGANGVVAAREVLRAAPDGYTTMYSTNGTVTLTPFLSPEGNFDPLRDLRAVSLVQSVPSIILVARNSRFKKLDELIAEAKANPDKINFGSTGVNSTGHLIGEYFSNITGITMTHIPYKGAAQYTLDLLAGRIDIAFGGSSTLDSNAETMTGLVVAQPKRSPLAPDVPSAAELGLPDYQFANWSGVFAPKDTPDAIVEKLDTTIGAMMSDPDVLKRVHERGSEPTYLNSKDFTTRIENEIKRVATIVQAAGMKPIKG
jgi:tripartite-type tricarboxylate transporter receptor subunit TctC